MAEEGKKVEENKGTEVQETPKGVTEYKPLDEFIAEESDKAAKIKEDAEKNGVKTNKDGVVIGVDGENPVSNVNPDPRSIRGYAF